MRAWIASGGITPLLTNLERIMIESSPLSSQSIDGAATISVGQSARFLTVVAHELRAPLAAIRLATRMVANAVAQGTEVRRNVGVIERQAEQMARLVSDLFDYDRILQGAFRLQPEWIDLKEAVEAAVEATRPIALEKNHNLSVVCERSIQMFGDAARITQVVTNLLVNAVHYTQPGGSIRLKVIGRAGHSMVSVQDTGIGIAPEVLPTLFNPDAFCRQASSPRTDGLGIGLALARTFIELHGGTIEAQSEGIGRGSRFTVKLPTTSADRAGLTCRVASPSKRNAVPTRFGSV